MRLALLASAGLLAGCATGMSERDCASANWFAIGERDGLFGEPMTRQDERFDQCSAHGLYPDLAAYRAGRERGLRQYCTPESGFDAGRSGREYYGVCPRELEADFLDEYEIGLRLHSLTSAVESAISSRDEARRTLQAREHDLRAARDRLRDPGLSEEERTRLNRDIDRYRREVENLERQLPNLDRAIREAESRLEDYRGFLARRARRY
jgi:hypothetical protein